MNSGQSIRVLFVDDETSFLLANKIFLENQGFLVETAQTGEEALSLLSQHKYDVILLDYILPGISGLNVLQWMHEQKMDTPVVMMTGMGSEGIAVEVMKLGAYDYIRKEQHDRLHLPILVRGVHERHLFRLEKEIRVQGERGREKHGLIVDMFSKSISTLGHIVNNTLSLLTLSLEEQSKEILPAVQEDKRKHFQKVCEDMTKQTSLVSHAIRSLMILSEALREGLAGSKETRELEEIIQENLTALQGEHDNETKG
ncbi:MAG TPA: response regulator [Bacteroidota bacterium]|nr:response regulator [Bacteroidota bacterium]